MSIMHAPRAVCVAADEAIKYADQALQVASSVHGGDHPVMESFWQALAEMKQEVGRTQCFLAE